jgi:pimeloyl-ACP methyl ester carboxylesterase
MMREWIEQLRDMETWQPRRYPTLELAIAALRQHNVHLRLEQARQLAVHGTKRNADGSLSWKFDNYQRVRSPYKFSLDEFTTLLARIACPVLLVQGAESSSPARSGPDPRRYFRDARLAVIAAAGHWVHHDRLADLLAVAGPFLRAH